MLSELSVKKRPNLDIFCHLWSAAIQSVLGGRRKLRDYHIYEDPHFRGTESVVGQLKLDFFVKLL